jgi:PAS domain S-box-containing protein
MTSELRIQEPDDSLHLAFDENPMGMSITRFDLTYVRVNKALCALLGYRREQLIGRNVLEITHPDDVEISRWYAEQLFEGYIKSYAHERRFLRSDQHPIWVEVTATILHDSNQTPRYRLAMVADISARRQLEQERSERTHLEGVLLAASTMQHELNNRLAIVVGNTELLLHKAKLSADVRPLAQEVLAFARSAAELVNQLVSITHVERREWGPGLTPTIDIPRSIEASAAASPDPPEGPMSWEDLR